MNKYTTITEVAVPADKLSSKANNSNIWGKVYQNYISANLSSEQLGQGAYDAYNLLTYGLLDKFSKATINAIGGINTGFGTINGNFTKIDKEITTLETEWSKLFTSSRDDGWSESTEVIKAKSPLEIPIKDDRTLTAKYDLSSSYTIPLLDEDAEGPGLLRLSDFNKFTFVSEKFHDKTIASGGWQSEANITNYPTTPIMALVYKVNSLQAQVNTLLNVINGLLSGGTRVVFGKLNVKQINFVDTGDTEVKGVVFDKNYINPALFSPNQAQ